MFRPGSLLLSPLWLGLCSLACCVVAVDRNDSFIGYTEKGAAGDKGCRDRNSNCLSWASEGECDKNAGFMHGACPVACKQCTPPELNWRDYEGETLILDTTFGKIRIKMLFENAPRTCALIMDLAHQGAGDACNFYRNEAKPQDGGEGPPYGLLQGSLAGMIKVPPAEANGPEFKPVYGYAAMITGTTEFYIALVDHTSWKDAHTVWGQVLDMPVVERIVDESGFTEFKHPEFGTVMRMMKGKVPFKPSYQAREVEL